MAVTSGSTALQSISRQSDGTWIRPGQAGGLLVCCVIRNDAHVMQQVCVSGLAVSSGTCDRFSTSHTGVEGPSRARLGRSTRQGSHHDRQRLRTVLRRRRTVEFAHRRADACRPSIRGRPCADGRPPRGDASRGRPLRITGRHRSGTRHADRGAAGSGGPRAREISSETKAARIADMERTGRIRLGGLVELPFSANDIGCHPRVIRPRHPNAMELRASTRGGARLPAERYYSVGGGFVVTDDESDNPSAGTDVPFGYGSRRRDRPVPVGRGCDRRAHQIGGVDLGCRRGLPGRGGFRGGDGRRCTGRDTLSVVEC